MVGLGGKGGSVLFCPVLREKDVKERNVFMIQTLALFLLFTTNFSARVSIEIKFIVFLHFLFRFFCWRSLHLLCSV
jgi:hypothetical protein